MKTSMLGVLVAAVGMLAGGASAQAQAPNVKGQVKVDGSSTVGPISMAVAEEFKKVMPGVEVSVGISGTGGGFKKSTAGEIDISDASRPITKEELDKAGSNGIEFIELPIAFDGLTLVVNPKNTWASSLTVDELKKIYLDGSAVKTWKDIRPEWPDKPIKLYSPGTDSGTFDYFKEVVAGKKGAIRGDMSVSEDDNVLVRGVEGDEGALGFFGIAYYEANQAKLKAVAIDAGKGAVAPSHETVEKGTYAPFGRPLFIYVNAKSAARPAVREFVKFYLSNANKLVEQVGYVKLPETILARAKANFDSKRTGTQFLDDKGQGKHGPLEELYR